MNTIRKILIGLILGSLFSVCHGWYYNDWMGNGWLDNVILDTDGAGGAIVIWEQGTNIYADRVNHQGSNLWGQEGTTICTTAVNDSNNYDQNTPWMVSDGEGGAIIVWQDGRSSTTYRNIYTQRVNSMGSTLWIENGLPICEQTTDQTSPRIVSDNVNGAIISWQDFRNGSTYNLYAQRVNSQGSTLWTSNAVALCTTASNQTAATIINDGIGGAFIVWQDFSYGNSNIFAQHIDTTGELLWSPEGIAICTASNDQILPVLTLDGSNGIIVAWQDGRNSTTNNNIYAQRINSNGSTMWTSNGLAICNVTTGQTDPQIISDEYGGAIIVWEDGRTGTPNIYGQRVNSLGSTYWQSDGIPLANPSDFEDSMGDSSFGFANPYLVSDGLGGAIIAFENIDNSIGDGLPQSAAYRIDNLGNLFWIEAFSYVYQYGEQTKVIKNGDGGFLISWNPIDNFRGAAVQQVDLTGNTLGPYEILENLPDVKLFQATGATDVFNLNNYYSSDTAVWSWSGTTVNIHINPDNTVDYLTPMDTTFIGQEDVTYTAISIDTEQAVSVVKYSSYLLSKLPQIVIYGNTVVENGSIDLSQYVSPSVPSSWLVSPISYTNSTDLEKLTDGISSNILIISCDSTLLSPASIIVTATGTTSNDWDSEIVRVYPMLNNYGLFNSSSDTAQWVYENAPNTTVMPTIGYLNTYNGATGILKLSFSSVNQGVKMTLGKSNWLTSSTGQWYTIRMKVMSDTSNNTFSPMLFIYNGVPGNPFDVSVHVLVSVPTTWTWMETAVYCDFTASLYPQLLIRNGNSIGNIYVDAIEIIQAEPGIQLAYGNTRITNADGDWQNASETTGWAFQSAANAALANYFVSGGSLNVSFDGTTTEGIKMTGATGPGITATSSITPGKSAGMKMNLSTSGTMDNPIFLLSVFGTDSQGGQNFTELGASAAVWYVPSSGQLETSYIPLQPYIYGQVQVKNSGNGIFYLNNTYLQADTDSPYYWDHSLY
jgi:hypothetical protein